MFRTPCPGNKQFPRYRAVGNPVCFDCEMKLSTASLLRVARNEWLCIIETISECTIPLCRDETSSSSEFRGLISLTSLNINDFVLENQEGWVGRAGRRTYLSRIWFLDLNKTKPAYAHSKKVMMFTVKLLKIIRIFFKSFNAALTSTNLLQCSARV